MIREPNSLTPRREFLGGLAGLGGVIIGLTAPRSGAAAAPSPVALGAGVSEQAVVVR